jgi:tRNA pseudouridine38-40 synthase
MPPDTLRRRVNDALPSDIYIRRFDKAPHRFHARHDAESRSYLYQISRRKTALLQTLRVVGEGRSRRAADARGRAAVRRDARTSRRSRRTNRREVDQVLVDRLEIAERGDLVLIRIVGSHFLWRMVRRLVGVLAAVGRRTSWTPDQVSDDSSRSV